MGHWARKKLSANKMEKYRAENNAFSLDGCPGMRSAMKLKGGNVPIEVVKARATNILKGQWEGILIGLFMGIFLVGFVKVIRSWIEEVALKAII